MLRRLFCFVAALIIVSGQFVDVANAAYDKDFYSGNDILFYDPRCATETGSGTLTLAGNDNLEKILNFYMRKGLTLAQASGMVGNMMVESGLDPTIIQGGNHATPGSGFKPSAGIGFGLVQWTSGGRQVGLVSEINRLGVDITDLSGQLGYSWKELSESYSSTLVKLKATDDPIQAAIVVHDGYESSADSQAKVVSVRGGNAQLVYNKYVDAPALAGSTAATEMTNPSGIDTQSTSAGDVSLMSASTPTETSATTPTTSGNCSAGGDFAGGDLAQTTQQYAWPQYGVRTDQMPAYTEAVSRAKAKGQYIGGNNGNDCGGFVTRLMIDSGFEKRYNSDGKGGNTTSQEAWLRKNWKQISSTDAGDRQPGDVAINDSHTYVYVGQIPGFGNIKIASASLGGPQRSPMAGHESASDSSFHWYRKNITLAEAPK